MPDIGEFRGEHLQRALVVPELAAVSDAPKLQAVLLFEDGLVMHWFSSGGSSGHVAENPAEDHVRALTAYGQFRPSDDVGTDYKLAGGGSGGNGRVTHGEEQWVPAVPAQATKLFVLTPGGIVELSLSS